MGLDSVELILAIEERFQVEIADEEASSTATVGELHHLLLRKLQPNPAARCLTSVAFYRTRRALVEVLNIHRRDITPTTPLASLFPESTRRPAWQRFEQALALRIPALRIPSAATLVILAVPVALALGAASYFHFTPSLWPLLFLAGLLAGAFLLQALPSLATSFPPHLRTVGDLARYILAANYAALSQAAGGGSPNEIWDALCRTIVDQTGVPRERITPDAHIVSDLGID